jgi:hypothetical protein
MDAELIDSKKRQIVERFGPWSSHNILLGDDVYTIKKGIVGDEVKLRRVLQIVTDVSKRPLESLRILDLACLEGLYAVEFARHGAEVVGIEGRETNIEKARFAKDLLGLEKLEFVQDDVRNLSVEKYGHFDVVLCLGILYHLDMPDVLTFLERIGEVCRGLAVIDTHVSLAPEKSYPHGGRTYSGRVFKEHEVNATSEERARKLWASLDNPASFWLTRSSLYNALAQVGFTSVHECHVPYQPVKARDRVTLLAVKGQREHVLSAPLVTETPMEDWAEEIADAGASATRPNGVFHGIGRRVPAPIRKLIKRLRAS